MPEKYQIELGKHVDEDNIFVLEHLLCMGKKEKMKFKRIICPLWECKIHNLRER